MPSLGRIRSRGAARPIAHEPPGLIVVGAIEGNTFQGEVKYDLDTPQLEAQRKVVLDYLNGGSSKPSSNIDVEAGVKMTITFAPKSATVNDVDWGFPPKVCTPRTGIFGRYTKDRIRCSTLLQYYCPR